MMTSDSSVVPGSWTRVTGNIWVSGATTTDPSRGAPHDGSQSGSGGYPGGSWFEEFDGSVTWGHQEKYINHAGDFSEFSEAYDWGWYGDHIYVYSTTDPGTAYAGMQVSQRQFAVGAGQAIAGIPSDYDGHPRDDPPSLGALEYVPGNEIFSDGFESGGLERWSATTR